MQKKKERKKLSPFLFILRSLIMNTNFKLVKYTHTHSHTDGNDNELPHNVTILLKKCESWVWFLNEMMCLRMWNSWDFFN